MCPIRIWTPFSEAIAAPVLISTSDGRVLLCALPDEFDISVSRTPLRLVEQHGERAFVAAPTFAVHVQIALCERIGVDSARLYQLEELLAKVLDPLCWLLR